MVGPIGELVLLAAAAWILLSALGVDVTQVLSDFINSMLSDWTWW